MPLSPKETCFSDIRQRILRTELAPGAVLDEASLASRYGLSRTPLREVLQRLAGAGYITQSENRGAKVASMDVAVLRVFFQTAPMIYASISRLAAENRNSNQILTLQRAQDDFAKNTKQNDASAAALANHRFHAVIGEMASNPYLSASLDRLLIDHTRLSQTFYDPKTKHDADLVQSASDHHEQLIDAIEKRDSARAVEVTLQHWDLSRDRIARFVRPDPLPFDGGINQDEDYAI